MRSRQKRSSFPLITIIVVFVLTAAGIYICMNFLNSALADSGGSGASVNKIKSDKLYSENVILVNADTGEMLYGKNENETCYPASLTKIMTAITAIKNRESLDKQVYLDPDIFCTLRNENASMAGYYEGDTTTVEDLLYGCLLSSGADASAGLAKATSGSSSAFVAAMNDSASELDMTNTHFTNTSGLQDQDHYTTAKDMSKLLCDAIDNQTFRDVFTCKSHNIKAASHEFTIKSTFFSEYSGGSSKYTVLGAKTGTTSDAGQCLASLVSKDGREYILITMDAPMGGSRQPFSFDDLDYIFSRI